MEYAEKGDLSTYANEPTPKIINIKIKWVVQILDGIGFLHKIGMIHLDLKPQNVVITSNEYAKVFNI